MRAQRSRNLHLWVLSVLIAVLGGVTVIAFRYIFSLHTGIRTVILRLKKRVQANSESDLALPPEDLVVLVAGVPDTDWFLEGGRRGAKAITDVMAKHDRPVDSLGSILDFGCGCGRVLRHWKSLPGTTVVYGTDYNERLVNWSRKNLRFARFNVNQLTPPLAYADDTFDLVYALSVFTHLTEDLCEAWMDELYRIVKPGGAAIVTTHGGATTHLLSQDELRDYEDGAIVVQVEERAGENLCMTFHPPTYVAARLIQKFTLAEFIAEGALGNPPQDLSLLIKP
jgi:ubiquinone/menaquinone biosynthesis C-methylase UbiE